MQHITQLIATLVGLEDTDGLATLGGMYVDLQSYEEALIVYECLLALEPQNAHVWRNKRVVLARLGRDMEALLAIDQALALDEHDAAAWKDKAETLRALGRIGEAQEAEARAKALGG
jgi:tetratricopeptide (TPR) repeat protein